jgi:hypothetical protein
MNGVIAQVCYAYGLHLLQFHWKFLLSVAPYDSLVRNFSTNCINLRFVCYISITEQNNGAIKLAL